MKLGEKPNVGDQVCFIDDANRLYEAEVVNVEVDDEYDTFTVYSKPIGSKTYQKDQ